MRTLNISISDLEFSKLGLKKDNLSFSELLDLVSNELTKRALNESIDLAEQYRLADMSMEDITREVNAVRRDAKGNS
jgi:predicted CopG family antitoxin